MFRPEMAIGQDKTAKQYKLQRSSEVVLFSREDWTNSKGKLTSGVISCHGWIQKGE